MQHGEVGGENRFITGLLVGGCDADAALGVMVLGSTGFIGLRVYRV